MSDIEARVRPAQIQNQPGAIEVVTTETKKEIFPHLGALSGRLSRDKWGRIANGVLAGGLAIIAATELSKTFAPLMGLQPLTNITVLENLSRFAEDPVAIGVFAAFAAAAFAENALRGRKRFEAIRAKFPHIHIDFPDNGRGS